MIGDGVVGLCGALLLGARCGPFLPEAVSRSKRGAKSDVRRESRHASNSSTRASISVGTAEAACWRIH